MENLSSNPQLQIVVAIVAAAAISCVVGWSRGARMITLRQHWVRSRGHQTMHVVPAIEESPRDFGVEFVTALALAVDMAITSAWDEEAIVDSIVSQLGWSPTRARWFLAVNREYVQRGATSEERPPAPA